MTIPPFRLGQHIAICGEKGAGKTFRIRSLIKKIGAPKNLILYCKPDDRETWKGWRNAKLFRSQEELTFMLESLRYSGKYQDTLIFVDDPQGVVQMDRTYSWPKTFSFFAHTGRSMRCSLIMSLHWLRRFPVELRGEIDYWVLHKPSLMSEPMYRDMFGDKITDGTLALGPYECLIVHSHDRNPKVLERVPLGDLINVEGLDIWKNE